MTNYVTLVAASLLAFAAQAGDDKLVTADASTHSKATFEALDKNADAQISKTEAGIDDKLADGFAAIDTNGDGYVSKAEYLARLTI
jgi:Ca2+-binding EF-hand superfamily protein